MFSGKCFKISPFSKNISTHQNNLTSMLDFDPIGVASLQNALELSISLHKDTPLYCNKEILILTSAISTQDPGDLFGVIERLQKFKIQTSVLNLSVKNYIGEQITKLSGGDYRLAKDFVHFKTLLMIYTQPKSLLRNGIIHDMIQIGFPEKKVNVHAFDCNNKRCFEFYVCPICKAKNSELPTNCGICKTLLASAPFIARTNNSSLKRGTYFLVQVIKERGMDIEEEKGQVQEIQKD